MDVMQRLAFSLSVPAPSLLSLTAAALSPPIPSTSINFPKSSSGSFFGITFADRIMFGFDFTVSPTRNGQKKIQIILQGNAYVVCVDMLLFLSETLHGRGTT
ncbi:hypothetical protein HD554DRAFT_2137642, partial [Boletus coccyginus]